MKKIFLIAAVLLIIPYLTFASIDTYKYSGGQIYWEAPDDGTVIINAVGGEGEHPSGAVQGYGGSATGTISVTAGQRFYLFVGGRGGGGEGVSDGGTKSYISNSSTFSNAAAYIVAGAGGSAYTPAIAKGGNGGGTTGVDGISGGETAAGGLGGTQTGGGASVGGDSEAGDTDGVGAGGDSTDGNSSGGGDGYHGGSAGRWQGGLGSGGGGGGSSNVSSTLTATSTASGTNTTSSITFNFTAGAAATSTPTATTTFNTPADIYEFLGNDIIYGIFIGLFIGGIALIFAIM